jgi:protein TonB
MPFRRRLSGLALAVGVNVVLLLVLLTLGVIPVPLPKSPPSLVITFLPDQSSASAKRVTSAKTKTKQSPTRPVTHQMPPVTPEKPKLPDLHPLDMIEMSKDELAAADISKLPKAGAGSGAGDSETVGRGPNGEVLYAAEWAREPTAAELQGYIPRNAPEGSGLVACKTIPGDRVDDCIELGSDPPGSRLASAVRQAAWQFRVRPPRRGGKELVGSWVRIRIDYYHSEYGK